MKKILLTFALPDEVVPVSISGFETRNCITGVSKPYAAARLARAIVDERPDIIINIGSAGSMPGRAQVGDIFVCNRYLDRDIMRQSFTSISPEVLPTIPEEAKAFHSVYMGTPCQRFFTVNTGDDFVTADQPIDGDVVDMEGFAMALVASEFGIPFFSVKYVTDIIGQNSMQIWEERLAQARRDLTEYFKSVAERF